MNRRTIEDAVRPGVMMYCGGIIPGACGIDPDDVVRVITDEVMTALQREGLISEAANDQNGQSPDGSSVAV